MLRLLSNLLLEKGEVLFLSLLLFGQGAEWACDFLRKTIMLLGKRRGKWQNVRTLQTALRAFTFEMAPNAANCYFELSELSLKRITPGKSSVIMPMRAGAR